MRRLLTMVGVIFLLGSSSSFAQVSLTPGMGVTSPLGTMNPNAPSGPVGIPLGATGLDAGGLSPVAGGTLCASTPGAAGSSTGMTTSGGIMSGSSTGMMTSGTGIAGSSSTFDGGGSSVASTCNPAATGTSPGTAVTPSAGLGIGTAGSGNTIPLGATEVGTPGESTTIGVPVPSISATPCPGTSTMPGTTTAGTLGSTGTTSINGC